MVKGGDFCLTEKLEAVCAEDEVVVMQSAQYGRMQLGRCVKVRPHQRERQTETEIEREADTYIHREERDQREGETGREGHTQRNRQTDGGKGGHGEGGNRGGRETGRERR